MGREGSLVATPAQNLWTEYQAIAADMAQSTAPDTPPKYRSDAGGSRKGTLDSHRKMQLERMRMIREELTALGYQLGDDGPVSIRPFEIEHYGY